MTSSDHPHDQRDRSPSGVARIKGERPVGMWVDEPAPFNHLADFRLYDDHPGPLVDARFTAGAHLIRACAKALLGDQAALDLVDQLLADGELAQAEAVLRLVVAGMPPVLIDARMAGLALRLGLDALVRAFDHAADTLRSLLDVLPDTPPVEPRARALWLRQHRNTGPKPAHRAPRALNPRRLR